MMKNFLFATGLFVLMAFALPPKKKIKVWLIGDSTMSVKDPKAYPETGWGMPFVNFWDSTVEVDNRAMNGRSTRTFMEEKRWDPVVNAMQEGDYVFIQFGHNDEVPTKASATKPEEFKANLERYIRETRNKKASPVLFTPVARRKFDSTGKITATHDQYAAIVRTVAKEKQLPLIDMDIKSQQLLQQLGPEQSKLLFLWLAPGENPNYPAGKQDDTHFNELGARMMAQLVLSEMKNILPDLNVRIKRVEK